MLRGACFAGLDDWFRHHDVFSLALLMVQVYHVDYEKSPPITPTLTAPHQTQEPVLCQGPLPALVEGSRFFFLTGRRAVTDNKSDGRPWLHARSLNAGLFFALESTITSSFFLSVSFAACYFAWAFRAGFFHTQNPRTRQDVSSNGGRAGEGVEPGEVVGLW